VEHANIARGELSVVERHSPACWSSAIARFEANVRDCGCEFGSWISLGRRHFARPLSSSSISHLLPTMNGVR
jgi:hypothetical protein